jgi:hypothetical protein
MLYYLVSLDGELARRGKPEASSRLTSASLLAYGFPSEFFHEAITALTSDRADCQDVLSLTQLKNMESVVDQIKAAFQRIRGG